VAATKKIKLDEPAVSEILVDDTASESGAEASDLEDEFSESEEGQEASAQEDEPQAATSGGGSTNLGTASRKEHKNPPVCWSSKRLEKQ